MIQCEGEERERRGSVDDSSGWIVLYSERVGCFKGLCEVLGSNTLIFSDFALLFSSTGGELLSGYLLHDRSGSRQV